MSKFVTDIAVKQYLILLLPQESQDLRGFSYTWSQGGNIGAGTSKMWEQCGNILTLTKAKSSIESVY